MEVSVFEGGKRPLEELPSNWTIRMNQLTKMNQASQPTYHFWSHPKNGMKWHEPFFLRFKLLQWHHSDDIIRWNSSQGLFSVVLTACFSALVSLSLSSSSSCLFLLFPLPLVPSFSLCGFVSLHQVSKWLYRWTLSNLRYGRFLQYVHFFFLSVCLSVCLLWSCMLAMVCVCMSASVCPF